MSLLVAVYLLVRDTFFFVLNFVTELIAFLSFSSAASCERRRFARLHVLEVGVPDPLEQPPLSIAQRSEKISPR